MLIRPFMTLGSPNGPAFSWGCDSIPEETNLIVHGGKPLRGTVRVSGSRKASLALIAGALLATDNTVTLLGVPRCGAVAKQIDLLSALGVSVHTIRDTIVVEPPASLDPACGSRLTGRTQAALLFAGPLLARTGRAMIPWPGPTETGPYPTELHIKGLTALGATTHVEAGYLVVEAAYLQGTEVFLDYPSRDATQTLIMAATGARGKTTIRHAAKDPEIVDLVSFLSKMGARIRGAGTEVVTIDGGCHLQGAEYQVMGDRHEAALYLGAALATGGHVSVKGVEPIHLLALLSKLREIGAAVSQSEGAVHIVSPKNLQSTLIRALPYPGFASDLYLMLIPSLSKASGTSIVSDATTPDRLLAIEEMRRLGVKAINEPGVAVVSGNRHLTAASVRAPGPISAPALLICLLAAEGIGSLSDAHHLDTHYVDLVDQLVDLGAHIYLQEADTRL